MPAPMGRKSSAGEFQVFAASAARGDVKRHADIGYVLTSGELAIAGKATELLADPDVGRLFLGG